MKTKTSKKKLKEKVHEAYVLVGSNGGKATFKKVGKTGMSELGKQGAKARWGKKVDKSSTKKSEKRTIK